MHPSVNIHCSACLLVSTDFNVDRAIASSVRNDSLSNMEVLNTFTQLMNFSRHVNAEDGRIVQAEDIIVLHLPVDRVDCHINHLYGNVPFWWRVVRSGADGDRPLLWL